MNGTVVWADEPAPARPHRVLLRLVWQEQRLDASTLDACARIAAAPPSGYDPARWRGPVPGEHVAAFRRVIGHVSDAPGAHLQPPPSQWDDAPGNVLVTAAVHGGPVVAATVIVVPDGAAEAEQHETAVLPQHRGHGLARWVKATQTLWLHELYPAVERVTVTVSRDNHPMLAANRAVGYRDARERLLVAWTGA